MNKEILEFYKKQGERTKVKKETFKSFPNDIKKICEIIRGLGIHPCDLSKIGLNLPKERIKDRYLRTIQEVIDKIKKLDENNLTKSRKPEDKIVIICKHFAMLLASILREKGIPARCRCGFATYFKNGWFEDHWICEYWNGKKWVRVDPQIDKTKSVKKQITSINFTDMPKDVFFPAGILWQLYRKNLLSGDFCGFSHEKGENGKWYIRGNMLRDFFALNKIEYTYQEESKLMDRNYNPTKNDLKLLDQIAELTINSDKNFKQIRKLYNLKINLRPKN